MKRFLSYIAEIQKYKKLSKTGVYLSVFAILLFLFLALTLPNYLLKHQQTLKSRAQQTAAACTQYVSNSSELQSAMNSATANAVVCLKAATYTGTFAPVNSGTSGNLIVFQADPAAT